MPDPRMAASSVQRFRAGVRAAASATRVPPGALMTRSFLVWPTARTGCRPSSAGRPAASPRTGRDGPASWCSGRARPVVAVPRSAPPPSPPAPAVAQVQPSGHQVDLVDAGESFRLADDVDDAGVAAPGDDHESPAADVRHQRLVFMDQRVVSPLAIHPCLVTCRQAGLGRRRARHLAGDQQHAAEQERRLPVLDQAKPASSMPARLGVGRSTNRPGEAIRRRDQKSGWSRAGNLRPRSA